MQDAYCCGREMYQEIGADNYLISICRSCGKTIRQRVNFSGRTVDGIDYFAVSGKGNIENLNTNLGKGKQDETL